MRYSGPMVLILLMLQGSVSTVLAEDASPVATSLEANESVNAIAAAEDVTPEASASIQGIWQLSLEGTVITVALNQSGDTVFGQAKFEGADPWNGAVAGSVSGKIVHLAVAALEGEVLVSTYMACTAEGDSITGSYVRYDGSGATEGDLSASRVSSDTSGYTPAMVAASATAAEALPQPTAQPATAKKSPFKDVRELAKGIDPNIMPKFAPL